MSVRGERAGNVCGRDCRRSSKIGGKNGNQAMHLSDLYLLVALACVITFLHGPL